MTTTTSPSPPIHPDLSIEELTALRDSFFTKGHDNSYRRDRYDQWDALTAEIHRRQA